VSVTWPVRTRRVLYFLFLDLLSLPGLALAAIGRKRFNAQWHLQHVCPRCPRARRAFRDQGDGECAWFRAWSAGRYDGPATFGLRRWWQQYRRWTPERAGTPPQRRDGRAR